MPRERTVRLGRTRNLRQSFGTATTIARTVSETAARRWLYGMILNEEPVNKKRAMPATAIASPATIAPRRKSRSLSWLRSRKASKAITTTENDKILPTYGRLAKSQFGKSPRSANEPNRYSVPSIALQIPSQPIRRDRKSKTFLSSSFFDGRRAVQGKVQFRPRSKPP